MVNKIKLKDSVDSLLLREGDLAGRNRIKYMGVAKDLFLTLRFQGMKDAQRILLPVDPKTNSINVPANYLAFCTISVPRKTDGKFIPLIRNHKLTEEVIDLSMNKTCGCECGCESELCGQLHNYEAIQVPMMARMPDGTEQEFMATERKKVNPDGSFYRETSQPTAIYTDGVHTATELRTEEEHLCQLEVSACGCVPKTPTNLVEVQKRCIFSDCRSDCGAPAVGYEAEPGNPLQYNISDDGQRIIFPSNFNYTKVMLRYYYEAKTRELMLPRVAKRLFMFMLQAELVDFDKKAPIYLKRELERKVSAELNNYRTNVSRMTLTELYHMIHPNRN